MQKNLITFQVVEDKTILQCESSLACSITVKSVRVNLIYYLVRYNCFNSSVISLILNLFDCELGTDPDSVEFWKVYSKQYNLLMQSR